MGIIQKLTLMFHCYYKVTYNLGQKEQSNMSILYKNYTPSIPLYQHLFN